MGSRILALEHATIRPLGEYPDHCPECRAVSERQARQDKLAAETREFQATCTHPEDRIQRIDITSLGSPRQIVIAHCERCGKKLDA